MLRRLVALMVMSFTVSLPAAELTFYCPFDDKPDAKFAVGIDGAVCRMPTFTEGHKGKALYVKDKDSVLVFDAEGNLSNDRGTIELWVKGDWDGNNTDWQSFVWQAAGRKPGSCAIWLWKYKNNIRFDIRRGGNTYVCHSMEGWKRGEWHHIVAAFDCTKGIRLYVDGKLAASKEFTWEPRKHGAFYVGARENLRYPAQAAIDELRIYNAALTDAEVAEAYQGKLEVAHAKPLPPKKPVLTEPPPAKLIFHLPFDDSFGAATAGGEKAPKQSKGVQFVDGVVGKAAEFKEGCRLAYAEKGNLRKDRGSLCFWYRPDSIPKGREDRCMFRENGPNKSGENAMWFWVWGLNSSVRFDLRDAADRYVCRNISDWKPGTWHFLAVTWDSHKSRRVYVDGQYIRGRGDSRSGYGLTQWETKDYDEFFVGSDGRRTVADGAIDEFRIYDAPLSAEDITKEYLSRYPVTLDMRHVYFLVGKKTGFAWRLKNISNTKAKGTISWSLVDAKGNRLAGEENVGMNIEPKARRGFTAEITPTVAGELKLTCTWKDAATGFTFDREFSCWVVPQERPVPKGDLKLKLIREIDCTQSLDKEQFVGDGQSKIVEATCGTYREAGPKRHSRFAYRILTPEVGKPHMLQWDYPDDKARTMDVILQDTGVRSGTYDVQTGVFCGAEYPLSNKFLTHEAIFWPRQEDQALVFMTAEEGRPAAVSRIRLYEIEGRLPALPVKAAPPRNGWERMVGIYYEDPVLSLNFGGERTMPGFEKVTDRLLDYMGYFGQNILMYPGIWYRGPFFPTEAESRMDNQHGRPHPFNYIEYLCLRMGQRGMYFIPTFNVHSLPSLAEQAVFDEEEIRAGKETVLMMMWDNRPKTVGWHGTPPNFNPISPEAQRQFLKLIDEMLDLYGDLPAFKGICFHLTQHNILWFGSLDAGYNDCNIERFQKDTGTQIPVDARDPLRFNKRYRWLMKNAKEKWIAWRCRKIHEYYTQIARKLTQKRPDLRLILNLYTPSTPDEKIQMFKSVKGKDVFREINRRAGMDISLFEDEPNIVIQRTLFPADYRWTRVHRGVKPETEISRQINFVDSGFAPLRKCRDVWINYHDRYWEDAIGRKKPLKGLWGGEMGWRVSTLNPNLNHCMEFHAWPLASVDSFAFTKGGFVIGTIGMEKKLARFTQSFRALPAVKFDDVPGMFDPVSVRQLRDGDVLYFYLVNRLSCSVKVQLEMTGNPGKITDLRSGDVVDAEGFGLTLEPYALESFVVASKDMAISGGSVKTPSSYVEGLTQRLAELREKARAYTPDPQEPVDVTGYFVKAERLLKEGSYGQLHFLLEDTRARKLDMAE
ncbi:MAG: LamG domain-containing protein [Planctomycetes bacterium]|nr:LamG domain-containing protein [Planctomycetota bacterium]